MNAHLAMLTTLVALSGAVICGCMNCELGETSDCTCGWEDSGSRTCDEGTLTWNDCVCDPCELYVETVCGCDGVAEFYEDVLGEPCAEVYQPLIDEGSPEDCEMALESFEDQGGCDLFESLQ